MAYVRQGTSTNLFATFQNLAGVETASSTTPKITIIHVDAEGDTITDVDAQDMTLVSGATGQYYYTWAVAGLAYEGTYSATYSGTVETRAVSADETITVLAGDPDLSGDYYCSTLQITRASGIGVEIFKENLGTGDGTTDSYDTAKGNVINGSYSVFYADADSNDFTELVEDDDYTISLNEGAVLLTSAGITKVDDKVIYIDYVYSPKHSDTILTSYLPQIDKEVDKLTNNYWGSPKSSVQYFDGYSSGYPQTDEPYGTQIEPYPEYDMKYKGVNSITSVLFLDRQGDTDRTVDSTEYRILTDDDYQESRLLLNTSVPNGKANIKVTFVHGYATVPDLVQELASYIGGLVALVNISGGSYKDISTYSFPEGSVSIGQVYVNIRESIDQMKSRIDSVLELLGGNYDCV